MYIYGAGLAGLIAANVFRKTPGVLICEAQDELPNNHHALLRHRESHIADATGIPFKQVTVRKGINYEGKFYTQATPKLANMYSKKVTGEYAQRSIWNLDPVQRYIAPPNFVQQLAYGMPISFGLSITKEHIVEATCPKISTIPMPVLMRMMDYPCPEFKYRSIFTIVADVEDCDIYQTVYYPNPKLELYRMSITGNRVIAELIALPSMDHKEYIEHFLELDFGISDSIANLKVSKSKYGKIVPIDESIRRDFIRTMTRQYNVYSLGRFATWRNILLDDVYYDIKAIKESIAKEGYTLA